MPRVRRSRRKRYVRKLVVPLAVFLCFAAALLIALSFLPVQEKVLLHTRGKYHFWAHGLAFGLLACASISLVRSRGARLGFFFGLLLLGLGIEWGQHRLYHEPLERSDVLADSAGVVMGAVLALAAEEQRNAAGGGSLQ